MVVVMMEGEEVGWAAVAGAGVVTPPPPAGPSPKLGGRREEALPVGTSSAILVNRRTYMPVVGGWGPESQSLEPPEFYLRMMRSRNRWTHDWVVHCRRYRALGERRSLEAGEMGKIGGVCLRSFTYHERLPPNEGPEYIDDVPYVCNNSPSNVSKKLKALFYSHRITQYTPTSLNPALDSSPIDRSIAG